MDGEIQPGKHGSSHEAPAPALATNFSGGYTFITAPAHFPGKSISPSALEGHGLMPGMLKLGMAWSCDLRQR